jgi:hypothetical protein
LADQGQSIRGVSCPSVSMCVAGDDTGNILTSTDPTRGQSAWTKTNIARGDFFTSVSCGSVTLCAAVGEETVGGDEPRVFTSDDPGGGASAWSSARVGSDQALAVSCPSVSLCLVGTGGGDVVTSTDPMGGARAWKETPIDQDFPLVAVSSPSVTLCVAGDAVGNILTSTIRPAASAHGRKLPPIRWGPQGVGSAPSHARRWLCVAGDIFGYILTSTDPTGGANAWSSASVEVPPGCPRPSTPCISERLLVRDDHGTRVVDTAPPGHGNSIDNVALNGDSLVLSWTHDGAQRQLQLR